MAILCRLAVSFWTSLCVVGCGASPSESCGDPGELLDVDLGAVSMPVERDARPFVSCEGLEGVSGDDACSGAAYVAVGGSPGVTRYEVRPFTAHGGRRLEIELSTDGEGAQVARVCSVPYTDRPGEGGCVGLGRRCAVDGSVTLEPSDAESGAPQRLETDVRLADGARIQVSFSL